MTQRTKRRLLVLVFLLWICYTIFFSVVKLPERNEIDKYHLDVAFHFTSYVVMAVLGASLISWFVLVPALIVAGGTEIVQSFLPYRQASWSDFGTNSAGLALGLLLWWTVGRLRARTEKHGRAQR
jgi:VanZ family protein